MICGLCIGAYMSGQMSNICTLLRMKSTSTIISVYRINCFIMSTLAWSCNILKLLIWGNLLTEFLYNKLISFILCLYRLCRAEKSVMASSGFQADVKALQKHLAARHLVRFSKICWSCYLSFSVSKVIWSNCWVWRFVYFMTLGPLIHCVSMLIT